MRLSSWMFISKKGTITLVIALTLTSFISLLIAYMAISKLLKPDVPVSLENGAKQKLQASSLTIGILTNSSNYNDLAAHLRSHLENKVQVTIDGNESISYGDVRNRIVRKEWDIVFAHSPMLSVAAKENGYTFAARMFANNPPYYQASLFVKSNSAIQSLSDLKPTTTIAFGDFNSASSFYMPSYDLFGKTLRVDMGHRGQKIIEMVKNREADVGAAAYDAVKNDPNLRVIHLSRQIPGSNVYLSPNLSNSDRETLKQALLNAPTSIKNKANYDVGQEPDYSYFVKISQKAEEVLSCADFKHNPVDFFCSNSIAAQNNHNSGNTPNIEGRINGWSHQDNSTEQLNLSGRDNKVYLVVIPRQILDQIPGASNLLALQGKDVRAVGVTPREIRKGNFELKISQPHQLVVL